MAVVQSRKVGSYVKGAGKTECTLEVIVTSHVQNKGIPNLFHSQHVEGKVQIP